MMAKIEMFGLIRSFLKALLSYSALLLFVSFSISANELSVRFQHLTLEQGLSQEAVMAMTQDSDGFMWFGTQEGLNRYDGYSFTVYSHDDSKNTSITSDIILSIVEDKNGYLWIGTDGGGLNRFDRNTQQFIHYRNQTNNPTSLTGDIVRALFVDSKDTLWIGTDEGLNRYNASDDSFEQFTHHPLNNNSLSNNKIRTIVEDKTGQLWIGTYGGGLNRFNQSDNTFSHYRYDANAQQSIGSDLVKKAIVDSNGALWVATYDRGVSVLKSGQGEFTHLTNQATERDSIANNFVHDLLEDKHGDIWLATDSGLSYFQPATQSFVNFHYDPLDQYSLSNNRVTQLYFDRGGVFWVGTYGGLNKWNRATSTFEHIRNRPNLETSLSDNGVNAFAQSVNGHIWIGTYGGLNEFDGKKVRRFTKSLNENSISDQKIMSLYADNEQSLWIGTRSNGLDHLDLNTEIFSNYRHDPDNKNSLSANAITMIKPNSFNQLWVATFGGGLNLYNPESKSFTHFRHDSLRKNSLSSDRIMSLIEEKDGLLWLGTWGSGINLFNPSLNQGITYKHDSADNKSISNDVVFTIYEDTKSNLWFGTNGGGLNKLSAENRAKGNIEFSHYNRNHGLPSNVIFGILEDEQGNLWLSSNRGLSKFDPTTNTILNYDSSHGLQGNEFNAGAYYKDVLGKLYFGGTNGVTAFDPDKIEPNSHVPPVVLTNFLKMNMSQIGGQSFNHLDSIEIRYEDYFVAFEFAGLDYASPLNNRYKYKLDGFDKTWIDAGTLRRATYTNLPAGHYYFKVKAANNDGVWNEHGINLAVTVLPPPWKSWWAYLGYFILTIMVLGIIIKAYLNKLQKSANYRIELQKEVENRTQELQEVNGKLLNASITDQLTELHNRRYLNDIVEKEVAEINRGYYSGESSANRLFVLMLDLDGFKPVNDTHGHSAGDSVITKVSKILKSVCRDSDSVIRWGGDEFLIMGKVDDTNEVSLLADRLKNSISSAIFDLDLKQTVYISCSIGFSFYPFTSAFPKMFTWEQVQVIADKALYHAKELGRDTWIGVIESENKPPVSFMSMISVDLENVAKLNFAKIIKPEENN